MSQKYIPPHKRRSSSNKPPPASTNQRPPIANNKYRHNCRFRGHQNHVSAESNNRSHLTLNETKLDMNNQKVDTLNLDQLVEIKKQQQNIIFQILTQYSDKDVAQIILYFCGNDIILIPNTFDRNEFLQYWFLVGKGEECNEFRNKHRVDLYPYYLQLIERGAIASVKGYTPSKTAQLKLECKFIYHSPRDHITLSLQSKGIRDTVTDRAWSGEVYGQDHIHIFNRIGWQRSNRIWIKTRNGNFVEEHSDTIPAPPLEKELKVTVTSDGEKLRVEYLEIDRDKEYFINCECGSDKDGYNRVVVFNRMVENCICDISFLQLSVVTKND